MNAQDAGVLICFAFILGAVSFLVGTLFKKAPKVYEDSADNIPGHQKPSTLEELYERAKAPEVILVAELADEAPAVHESKIQEVKPPSLPTEPPPLPTEPPPLPTEPDLSCMLLQRLRGSKQWRNDPEVSDFFRPSGNGNYKIRILPAGPKGIYKTQTVWIARKQHYLDGYTGTCGRNTVQCPKRLVKCVPMSDGQSQWTGDCPICKHNATIWAHHQKAEKKGAHEKARNLQEEAIKCKGVDRFYYNVLVYPEDGSEPQVKIYSVGRIVHGQIQAMIAATEDVIGSDEPDIVDLGPDGYNIRVIRQSRYEGAVGYPQYHVRACVKPSRAGTKEQVERWMANLWDLEFVAQKWEKTESELRTALVASDIIKFPVPRCQKCSCQLHESSGNEAVYCSKECLNAQRNEDRAGCPICGECEVAIIGGLQCYKCGFAADRTHVKSHCRYAPKCDCYISKKSASYLITRGCACNAEVKLVGKRLPHELVGKWKPIAGHRSSTGLVEVVISDDTIQYHRRPNPPMSYTFKVNEKDKTYDISGDPCKNGIGTYFGIYKLEDDRLIMRYGASKRPNSLTEGDEAYDSANNWYCDQFERVRDDKDALMAQEVEFLKTLDEIP